MLIGEREIGLGHPPYVIAEIGVNHDGDVERALELCDAAADAGADAVKIQYFETDRLMSKAAKLAAYQKAAGETDPVAMLRRLELSLDDCAHVIERAHARGLHAIVTVFSLETVDDAMALPWDALKTASPDIVNYPLLRALMRDGRPMIVSTGAAEMDEVVRASGWLGGARARVAMLQCVSSYPAPDAALGGIGAIADATGLPTGYSDHTEAVRTGADAVRAGAVVLERHLTYDRNARGPDHAASLEPGAFAEYTRAAHGPRFDGDDVSVNPLNSGGVATMARTKSVLACERDVRSVSRQSLVAVRGIGPGECVDETMLTVKRPGTGIAAYEWERVVGRAAARAIEADVPLCWDDLGGAP